MRVLCHLKLQKKEMVKYNREVGEGVGRDSSTVAKLLCSRAGEFSFFVVQTMFTLFLSLFYYS